MSQGKYNTKRRSFKHLKKELAFRDGEEAKDDEPVIRRKRKENRVIKLIKEVFWI